MDLEDGHDGRHDGEASTVSEVSAVSEVCDRGTPGRSADAEYRRRLKSDEARRRQQFGRLAWLATLLGGERQSTRAWSTGAHGERRVGAALERALGTRGIVLHDRKVPGGWGNIDHIAIAPSGVWVVDAKEYRGRVQRRDVGAWFPTDIRLYVGGRDRSKALDGARRQRDVVQRMVRRDFGDAAALPLRAAICLVGADWAWFARPFLLDDVWVAWPRRLGQMLLRPAVVDEPTIECVAAALAKRFPVR